MSKHTLILIRHAKAQHSSMRGDLGRVLAPQGYAQCAILGGKLADLLANVGAVLISPAARAQQTWMEIAEASGHDFPQPKTIADIYGGDEREIVRAIRSEGEGVATVVVGHEPTISAAGELLAKQPDLLPWGVSTATAIVLDASVSWKHWRSGIGENPRIIRAD